MEYVILMSCIIISSIKLVYYLQSKKVLLLHIHPLDGRPIFRYTY